MAHTNFGGDVLAKYNSGLAGTIFGKASPLLSKGSYLARLSEAPIENETMTDKLVSRGSTSSTSVPEYEAKPASGSFFGSAPVNFTKLIFQQRFTQEMVRQDELGGLGILNSVVVEGADSNARAIDVTATHGTDARRGINLKGHPQNGIFTFLTENAANEVVVDHTDPSAISAAIERAVFAIGDTRTGRASGMVLSPDAWSTLSTWRNQYGTRMAEQFGYNIDEVVNYNGLKTTASKAIAYTADMYGSDSEGTETNIVGIVGDFSKIRLGLKFDPVRILDSGNPDDQGDLGKVNAIVVRQEAWLRYLIENPEAFTVIRKAEAGGAGN